MKEKRKGCKVEKPRRANRVRDAVAAAGSQVRLAEQLGVTQAAVSSWCVQGWAPLARAQEIEALYGIPRAELANPRVVEALAPVEF